MGIPLNKIATIGLNVAGVAIGDKEATKLEKEENQLLAELIQQTRITNALLFKIIEDSMGEEAAEKILAELQG